MILWSAVPGFVSVLLLGAGVKEEKAVVPGRGSSSRGTATFALVSVILADAALSSGANAVHIRPRVGNFYSAAWAPIRRGRSRIIVAVISIESMRDVHLHLGRAVGRQHGTRRIDVDRVDNIFRSRSCFSAPLGIARGCGQ